MAEFVSPSSQPATDALLVPVDRQKNLDVVVTELIDVHGFLPLLNRFYWRVPSRLSVSVDSDQFEKNCN